MVGNRQTQNNFLNSKSLLDCKSFCQLNCVFLENSWSKLWSFEAFFFFKSTKKHNYIQYTRAPQKWLEIKHVNISLYQEQIHLPKRENDKFQESPMDTWGHPRTSQGVIGTPRTPKRCPKDPPGTPRYPRGTEKTNKTLSKFYKQIAQSFTSCWHYSLERFV